MGNLNKSEVEAFDVGSYMSEDEEDQALMDLVFSQLDVPVGLDGDDLKNFVIDTLNIPGDLSEDETKGFIIDQLSRQALTGGATGMSTFYLNRN